MEIQVLGDFEIAREILLGVARLFSNPEGDLITSAPAALLSGFLIWNFIKWGMDNEKTPFPAKEFVFGIAFWLIFGGGPLSPKYTVELSSVRENRFQVIDDVPFLAAVPSWLATSFFGSAREILEDNFSPIHYSKSSESRTPDPLNALIKLYDSGDGILIDPHLNKSISTYMIDCYAIEQSLDSSPLSNMRSELDKLPIHKVWDGVEVTYNFLTAKYYTKDDINGTELDCNTIWSNIKKAIFDINEPFTLALEDVNAKRGITNDAIEDASSMIYAAATHTSPNPLQIQQGLFLSFAMRDGLSQTSLEHWSDKMLFEAQRKRVFEAAGERSMFLQVMIPIITAIETFSFFIAPVMMVLSVLGGSGLALIMKYLMLVLFINLWGFIKVFVDLYTSMTVERAFSATLSEDPLAFGAYANTFSEIEGFLAVASSMTVAIPFFAMFLLYGGVHSVMGVMRTLGGGSVDGNNMAPTMSTTMNNGVMQQGDTSWTQMTGSGKYSTSHNVGVHTGLGTGTVSSQINGSSSNTSSTASNQVKSDLTAWNQQAATTFSASNSVANNVAGGTNIDFSRLSADQKMSALAHKLEESGTVKKGEGAQAVANLVASGGVSANVTGGLGNAVNGWATRFGLDAKASAAATAGWSRDQQEANAKVGAVVENWSQSNSFGTTGKDGVNFTNMDSTSVNGNKDESSSAVLSASQQVNRSVSQANAVNDEIANQAGITRSSQINFNALDGNVRETETFNKLNEMYSKFDKSTQERLSAMGIGDADALMLRTTEAGFNGRSFASNLQTFDSVVGGKDKTLDESTKDHRVLSQAYAFAGSQIKDEHSTGFMAASQAHQAIAQRAESASEVKKDIQGPNQSMVPTSGDVQTKADKFQENAQGRIAKAPSENTLKQNVTQAAADDAQATAASTGGPITPVLTSDGKAKNKTNDVSTEVDKRLNSSRNIKDLGPAFSQDSVGQGWVDSIVSGVSSINSWLNSPGRVWGDDAAIRAERMNSSFIQQGSSSMSAKDGLEMFMAGDKKAIDGTFTSNSINGTGVGPTASAYAMNDAYMLLKTPEGQKFFNNLPEGADTDRFKAAVGMFETMKYSDGNKQYTEQMDEVSARRIDGTLPERAASVLIANASLGDGAVPLMQPGWGWSAVPGNDKTETQGAAHLIANTESLNSSPIIRGMAGYGAKDEIKAESESVGMKAAAIGKDMIVEDEVNRLQASGAYNFTPGMDNGRNINLKDEDLKDGIKYILDGGTEVSASGVYRKHTENYDGVLGALKEYSTGSNETVAAGVAALGNSGADNLSSRLNASGYVNDAKLVTEFANANSAMLFESGSFTSEEQQKAFKNIGTAAINNQEIPEDLLKSVSPTDIKNNQVIDRMSYNSKGDNVTGQSDAELSAQTQNAGGYSDRQQLAGELRPSIAKSVAVAESGDGLVLFRGESTYQASSRTESGFEIASNKADYGATVAAALVGVHDRAMNLSFNEALKSNNGVAPDSFTSGTNQEFVRETGSDGTITYNGGDMGTFTYSKGDSRLMPTEDNPNYQPLDSVDKLNVGSDENKYGWVLKNK